MDTNEPGREPTDAAAEAIEVLRQRFARWWHEVGSGIPPLMCEEWSEHAERVARAAWIDGAFIASGALPMPDTPAPSTAPLGEECEHGHLARVCVHCELIAAEARVAELEAELAAAKADAASWEKQADDRVCDAVNFATRVAELEAKLAVIEKWTLAAEDKAPGSAVHAAFDRGYDAARRWVALHFKPTAPGKEPTDAQ